MSPVKNLSGTARGHLNDLALLNEKTTSEMARGISEAYLDREGAIALAAKLGVEAPKIKRKYYRYFTRTTVHSISIDAYTEEEADAEARRLHDISVAHTDIQYGTRSHFNRDNGRLRGVMSEITNVRPQAGDLPNLHRWELERIQAEAEGRASQNYESQIRWDSVIPR